MTSNRPYLLRALNQWIIDNAMTPYLVVDGEVEGVSVPESAIQQGKIILNISPEAVRDLQLGDDWVMFSARFGGKAESISVPVNAIVAIYARENGQGMMFTSDGDEPTPPPVDEKKSESRPEKAKDRASHLKVIK